MFQVTKQSDRKKYCNRSCSTTANNLKNPRRVKTKSCATCDIKISAQVKYCKECREVKSVLNMTIGQVKGKARYQVNSQLRQVARMVFKASGAPYICINCKYDKHVEICHVKDLHQFKDEDLVIDTVADGNLIPLCKNCHWEYDNGYLGIYMEQKPVKPSKQGNPFWAERAKKGVVNHLLFNIMEQYTWRN